MQRSTFCMALSCWMLAGIMPANSADLPPTLKRLRPDGIAEVKAVVTSFFSLLSQGKAMENLPRFRSEDIVVTGMTYISERKHWSKNVLEYLRQQQGSPVYLKLLSMQVDMVHPALAVARVKYQLAGQKATAIMTLSHDAKDWRIASMYVETYLVW